MGSRVKSVYTVDWVVAGDFIEDTQYYDTIWFVMVETVAGDVLCHETSFVNAEGFAAAKKLCGRIEAAGEINEDHWYVHEFFSKTIQERFAAEYEYEYAARNGAELPHNMYYSGGHC